MPMNSPAFSEVLQLFVRKGNLADLTAFPSDDQISICPVDVMNREVGYLKVSETADAHEFGHNPKNRVSNQA